MVAIIPITSLVPATAPPKDCSIRAVITLSWPYSSSTKQCALLLADPDFRLRNHRGQVRVLFTGPAAEAIAKSRIGIGDEVLLELDGAVWREDPVGLVSTPGRSVEGELVYRGSLGLKVVGQDRDADIRVRQDSNESTRGHARVPITPAKYGQIDRLRDGENDPLKVSSIPMHASPAFVRRLRLSGEASSSPVLDPFAEDDLDTPYIPRKRRKIEWRYTERSLSPPQQHQRSSPRADHSLRSILSSPPIPTIATPMQTGSTSVQDGSNRQSDAILSTSPRAIVLNDVVSELPTEMQSHHHLELESELVTQTNECETPNASYVGELELQIPISQGAPFNKTSALPESHPDKPSQSVLRQDRLTNRPVYDAASLEDGQPSPIDPSTSMMVDAGPENFDAVKQNLRHLETRTRIDAVDFVQNDHASVALNSYDGIFERSRSPSISVANYESPHRKSPTQIRTSAGHDPDDDVVKSSMVRTQVIPSGNTGSSYRAHRSVEQSSVASTSGLDREKQVHIDLSDDGHSDDVDDDADADKLVDWTQGEEEGLQAIVLMTDPADELTTPLRPSSHDAIDLASSIVPQSGSSTRSSREKVMDQTYRSLFGFDGAQSVNYALDTDHDDRASSIASSSTAQNQVDAGAEKSSGDETPDPVIGEGTFQHQWRDTDIPSTATAHSTQDFFMSTQSSTMFGADVDHTASTIKGELTGSQYVKNRHREQHGDFHDVESMNLDNHGSFTAERNYTSFSGDAETGHSLDMERLRPKIPVELLHPPTTEIASSHVSVDILSGLKSQPVMLQQTEAMQLEDHRDKENATSGHSLEESFIDDKIEIDSFEASLTGVTNTTQYNSLSQHLLPPSKAIAGPPTITVIDDEELDGVAGASEADRAVVSADLSKAITQTEIQAVAPLRESQANVEQGNRGSEAFHAVGIADNHGSEPSNEIDDMVESVAVQTQDYNVGQGAQDHPSNSLSTIPSVHASPLLRDESIDGVPIIQDSQASLTASATAEPTMTATKGPQVPVVRLFGNHGRTLADEEQSNGDLGSVGSITPREPSIPTSMHETTVGALTTQRQPGIATASRGHVSGEATVTPAKSSRRSEMEHATHNQMTATGVKSSARKSMPARLGHVPDAISSWFSPRRSTRLREVEKEQPQLVVEAEGERGREDSQPRWAAMGIATSYSYFVSLSQLERRLNNPGQSHHKSTVDILAVVSEDGKKAERAKSGPRDFFTVLSVTDPSIEAPANTVIVEVFRPWHSQLPIAHAGDVVLLRDFAVKSRARQPYLLSTDASAWCVWRYVMNESDAVYDKSRLNSVPHTRASGLDDAREEMKGPPVELGEEERVRAGELHGWWQGLQESAHSPSK